jgi:predicted RNA-binding Zn-ribbon protein involved in translation (DUF1610 family)
MTCQPYLQARDMNCERWDVTCNHCGFRRTDLPLEEARTVARRHMGLAELARINEEEGAYEATDRNPWNEDTPNPDYTGDPCPACGQPVVIRSMTAGREWDCLHCGTDGECEWWRQSPNRIVLHADGICHGGNCPHDH